MNKRGLPSALAFVALTISSSLACAQAALFAQDCNYTQSASPAVGGGLDVTFSSGSGAENVYLVYSVAAGSNFSVPMTLSNGVGSASIEGLQNGASVTYYFAYTLSAQKHQTDLFQTVYTTPVNSIPERFSRGMWVWNTSNVLSSSAHWNQMISGATQAGVTDLYIAIGPNSYGTFAAALKQFIPAATAAGLRVWGLDGARTYFSDVDGPANLYQGINNLIAYNNSVSANQRFFGFQADVEPQDTGSYKTFHSGIPDAKLSTAAGSGVWQSTQALDREMLMRDWLNIHQHAQQLLHAVGLRFGAAMPFWTSSYYGGEVQVSWPAASNTHQSVMKYMMLQVDDYVVMSYNTNPNNAASRVQAQAAYASTLPQPAPRVYGGVDVTVGVGNTISYGDTPGKNSKAVVQQDMQTITDILQSYPAFHGMAIEQWSAWQVLPP